MAIDWTKVENEYVTGTMSYQDIAAEKGISLTSIKAHGGQGGWNQKRKDYRRTCTERTAEKAAETVADGMATLKETLLAAAHDMAARLHRQITAATVLKPSEMLQYARTLVALNTFIDADKSPAELKGDIGIVILPAQSDLDPPI